MQHFTPGNSAVWVPFECSESVPANSIVEITGSAEKAGLRTLQVRKYTNTFTPWFGITGAMAGKRGMVAIAGYVVVSISGSGALGDAYGIEPSAWTAKKNAPGNLQALWVDTGTNKAGVIIPSRLEFLCKPTAAISNNSTGTVKIWGGAGGSEAATTFDNFTARTRWRDVSANKYCLVTYLNGVAYVSPLEC